MKRKGLKNRQWQLADVAAARLCRGGCCALAAAPLSRATAGAAARRRRALRSHDHPRRGVRGAARRSASASAGASCCTAVHHPALLDWTALVIEETARCSTRRSASVDRARQADCGLRESGRRSSFSGAAAAAAAAGADGADAAAGAARLCDSAHRARRWNLTRWAASRAAAVAARGWRRRLEAVVDFEFI